MNMDNSIEKILSELVIKAAKHFNFESEDALAAVAQSHLANDLCQNGNPHNLSVDQLSEKLYNEISNAM